jgi:hypothetical protein
MYSYCLSLIGGNMDIGVCGDNCRDCPRYTATRGKNAALLSELLHLYIKAGLRPQGTKAEELLCQGCGMVKECVYSEVKACAKEQMVNNCGECRRYQCTRIKGVFKKSETLKNEMRIMLPAYEMDVFENAFFRKEENLNRRHRRTHFHENQEEW